MVSKSQVIVCIGRVDVGVAGEVLGRYDTTLLYHSCDKGMAETVGGDLLVDSS